MVRTKVKLTFGVLQARVNIPDPIIKGERIGIIIREQTHVSNAVKPEMRVIGWKLIVISNKALKELEK